MRQKVASGVMAWRRCPRLSGVGGEGINGGIKRREGDKGGKNGEGEGREGARRL